MNREIIKKYGIVLILIFFTAITTVGIFYNYPLPNTVADETVLLSATLKMIAEPSLRPDYPTNYHMPFGAYMYLPFFIVFLAFLRLSGAFTSIEALKEFGILHFGSFLPMARFISVFLGVASVYLVYKICEKLFNNRFISLAASFLLATNFIFVEMAHFGRVWLPQIFVILLTFYFIVCFYEKKQTTFRDYLKVSFLTGVSFGTHFIGILIYLPFIVAHYLKNKGEGFKKIFITNKNFWLSNTVVVVVVLFVYYLNPYGFINYTGQSLDAAAAFSGEGTSKGGGNIDFFTSLTSYALVLFETGQALTILFILGLIPLFIQKRNLFFILTTFIVVYYIVIGPVVGSNSIKEHYIVAIIPFMAIVSAYGMYYFYKNTRLISNGIKILLLSALFIYPIYLIVLWDYWAIQQSTEVAAQKWIYNNVPTGARIVNFNHSIPLNETLESIEDVKRYAPGFLLRKQEYLLSVDESAYPKPNYYVLRPAYYKGGVPQEILNKSFDYVVISWTNQTQYMQAIENTRWFGAQEDTLVKIFPSDADSNTFSVDLEIWRHPLYNLKNITHVGPVVAVYELKK